MAGGSHSDGRGEPLREAAPIPPQTADLAPRSDATSALSLGGFRSVLRIADFRRLLVGQAVSGLGDWVGTLAFIVAAERLAPDRPAAVAGVLILRLLPSFLATPIGGLLSDRSDRKRIMIATDLARFGLFLAVPFAPHIGALYVFAFVSEALSLIFLPARDATVPNLVPKDDLEAANSLVMGSSFAAIPLSGPVFAGLAWAGAHFLDVLPGTDTLRARPYAFAFLFDAFTYLVSAATIARISLGRPHEGRTGADEPFGRAARAGATYIRSDPLLRGLAYAVTVAMAGGGVLFALGIGYVRETLRGGAVEFGWLMGLFGGGMVCGFLLSQLKPPGGALRVIRISLLTVGGVLVFMALFPVLWIGYLMAVVFGAAFSTSLIVAMSTVQARTEDAYRGRVMAVVHMLVRVALSVGALGAGLVAALVPSDRIAVPGTGIVADENQMALAVAGALIATATAGVRCQRGLNQRRS